MHDGGSPVSHIDPLEKQTPLRKTRSNEAFVSFHCEHEGTTQNRIYNKKTEERERIQQKGLLSGLITAKNGVCVPFTSVLFLSLLKCQGFGEVGTS